MIGPKFALKYIKLIFYGENQAEYGNDIDDNKSPSVKENFILSKVMTSYILEVKV